MVQETRTVEQIIIQLDQLGFELDEVYYKTVNQERIEQYAIFKRGTRQLRVQTNTDCVYGVCDMLRPVSPNHW